MLFNLAVLTCAEITLQLQKHVGGILNDGFSIFGYLSWTAIQPTKKYINDGFSNFPVQLSGDDFETAFGLLCWKISFTEPYQKKAN